MEKDISMLNKRCYYFLEYLPDLANGHLNMVHREGRQNAVQNDMRDKRIR